MFITFEVIYMYVYVQAYQLLVFLDVLFLLYFIIFLNIFIHFLLFLMFLQIMDNYCTICRRITVYFNHHR